jgi:5'-methylthioadenosine phosphorylase
MTRPYSPLIDKAIMLSSAKVGPSLRGGLVYVCVDGPRFETPAEIRMYRKLGGDVVGMTGVPEVVYANELGIGYSSIVIAANWAAGIRGRVNHHEILDVMRSETPKVKRLIEETVNLLSRKPRAAK